MSLGLVNVPVVVFPATRHTGVRLRMIGPEGLPLQRRYYCPGDDKPVDADQIVRGYELEDGSYITVTDKELEDLEPQKSREIDLREFVDFSAVSPAFCERGYFLVPLKDSTKAYRLLAEVMEKTARAGIATFVMRDREYLVAIFAQNGILCAETLRFHDEVRDPRDVGLPEVVTAPRPRVTAFERAIESLTVKSVPRKLLADHDDRKLRALIDKKKRAGKDTIRASHEHKHENVDADSDEKGDVDLLDVIRQSLSRAGKAGRRS